MPVSARFYCRPMAMDELEYEFEGKRDWVEDPDQLERRMPEDFTIEVDGRVWTKRELIDGRSTETEG